jgi:hypothetical protein
VVITEFFATPFFDKKERIFMWMTNGRRFHINLTQFAHILGLSSQLDIPMKLHSGRVMMLREMIAMYIPNNDFHAPKIDGLLPHFLVLHRMMRKTLAMMIGYSEAILAYDQNLLDVLMKQERFDVFEYIMDEIWNIDTNPLRSCGFAPYVQYMIEVVSHEKFYKDVRHEPLRPTVPKDPRAHCANTSTLGDASSHTTRSGGASSASISKTSILKMFRVIFAMCRCTDQRMDVMEQCLQIV